VWEKNGIFQKYGLESLFQMNGKNVVCSYKTCWRGLLATIVSHGFWGVMRRDQLLLGYEERPTIAVRA